MSEMYIILLSVYIILFLNFLGNLPEIYAMVWIVIQKLKAIENDATTK